ncbi:MAG: hypothetical protein K4H23_05500 [Mollicutes bacterium PWAP]|nr:hypothetical protein [Mollicutes bacterium PWAP]
MKNKLLNIYRSVIVIESDQKLSVDQIIEIKGFHCLITQVEGNQITLITDDSDSLQNLSDGFKINIIQKYVQTHSSHFGNIINPLGQFLEEPSFKSTSFVDEDIKSYIFETKVDISQRTTVNKQIMTKIPSIDLFNPLGFGQKEAIIGMPRTGKTWFALNALFNQKRSENTFGIILSIGTNAHQISEIKHLVGKHGNLNQTIIIHAKSSSNILQYISPYVAMAHAENLAKDGKDVILVIDDLTKHAKTIREIAFNTGKPIGKGGYPGDLFFKHSSLLERSTNYKNAGSITTLPIVETKSEDLRDVVVSGLISITDGQIVLNNDLAQKKEFPAVDLGLSVSRLGGAVQNKEMRKTSNFLKDIYYRYVDIEQFASTLSVFDKNVNILKNQGEFIKKIIRRSGWGGFNFASISILTKIIENKWFTLFESVKTGIKLLWWLKKTDSIVKNGFIEIQNGTIDWQLFLEYIGNKINSYIDWLNKRRLLSVKEEKKDDIELISKIDNVRKYSLPLFSDEITDFVNTLSEDEKRRAYEGEGY